MTWRGQAPVVKRLHGEYPDGVRLTRTQMKPCQTRLVRSKTLLEAAGARLWYPALAHLDPEDWEGAADYNAKL